MRRYGRPPRAPSHLAALNKVWPRLSRGERAPREEGATVLGRGPRFPGSRSPASPDAGRASGQGGFRGWGRVGVAAQRPAQVWPFGLGLGGGRPEVGTAEAVASPSGSPAVPPSPH